MPFILTLIGITVFLLGAIASYFSGIRAQQRSRRMADFRLRQRYIIRARWYLIGGSLSALVAVVLLVFNQGALSPSTPVPSPTASISLSTGTSTPRPSSCCRGQYSDK